MKRTYVQRNYKDTIFCMLFKEKENLLSLYNALNKTDYTDVDMLEITTLENAVYMNYKNDISFVFDFQLMLYEHQSTVNPNMPLRDLFYAAKVLQGLTRKENPYSWRLVKIPTPRFVVFYNGTEHQPPRQMLRLSDAFEKKLPEPEPELELLVTVYNINRGQNPELMEACGLLGEYAEYVERVRNYVRKMPFPEAVERAVDECIKENILAEFLSKNRAEAVKMNFLEFDEEEYKEWMYKTGHEDGKQQVVLGLLEMGKLSLEEIAQCAGLSLEKVQEIKEGMQTVQ